MTSTQEANMMDQIVALYMAWARGELDRQARLLNGLFDLAKEIDEPRMSDAFRFAVGMSSP